MTTFQFGDMISVGDERFVFICYDEHGWILSVDDDGDRMILRPDEIKPYTPPPPPNTVPVRIAVGVCDDGSWWSSGAHGKSEDDILRFFGAEHGDRISWITAHVPLPEKPAEVKGVVDA